MDLPFNSHYDNVNSCGLAVNLMRFDHLQSFQRLIFLPQELQIHKKYQKLNLYTNTIAFEFIIQINKCK